MKNNTVYLVYWALFSNENHSVECIPFSEEKYSKEYFDIEWNKIYEHTVSAINNPDSKDSVKNAPIIKLWDLILDKNNDKKKYIEEQKEKPHFLIDDIADNYHQLKFIDNGKTTISYIIWHAAK